MYLRLDEINNEQMYLIQFAEYNGIKGMAFRKKKKGTIQVLSIAILRREITFSTVFEWQSRHWHMGY
jgi:hypothetical protein